MKNYTLLLFMILGMSSLKIKGQAFEPYLGQMLYVSFTFAPKGWADCNGQELSINQNQALFALLGTTYGGNGTTTFALPNVQSRVLIGDNPTYPQGVIGGTESHTLATNEMPAHTHTVNAVSSVGNKNSPTGNLPADTKVLDKEYANFTTENLVTMNPNVVNPTGGNQSHNNIQPYITFKCIIALQGIYPSRN